MTNFLKINIDNINASDQVYIRTFMHFLRHPMNERWKIDNKNSHVYIINKNEYKNINKNSIIVEINTDDSKIKSNDLQIKKPFQLENFIDLLSIIEKKFNDGKNSIITTPKIDDNKTYKLTRWPPASLLKKDPNFMRISSTLINRYLSLQELQSFTNLTEDFCLNFIQELDQINCLSIQNNEADTIKISQGNVFSFITKIRNKFGL